MTFNINKIKYYKIYNHFILQMLLMLPKIFLCQFCSQSDNFYSTVYKHCLIEHNALRKPTFFQIDRVCNMLSRYCVGMYFIDVSWFEPSPNCSGNSSLASYIPLKVLAFEMSFPSASCGDTLWAVSFFTQCVMQRHECL